MLCLIKKTMFFLTRAATIRRVWAAGGSTLRAGVSRMGRRCWTVSCLLSFQTVLFPRRWDLEWSKVWPSTDRSPSSQRRGAKRAKGTFRWRACIRPWATGRKVRTLGWGAPRERRAVWGTEPGPSPPGTSVEMEEDRVTHTAWRSFGRWKRVIRNPTSAFLFLLIILSSVCFMSRIKEWFRCSSQRFLRRTSQESRRTTAAGNTQHWEGGGRQWTQS